MIYKGEDPEDPGLPDEFHDLQPELLRLTFRPPNYPSEQVFCGSDMNLYYDVRHHSWYKRPDWFAVVGVSRLYEQRDLRLSYVIWQEMVRLYQKKTVMDFGVGEIWLLAGEDSPEMFLFAELVSTCTKLIWYSIRKITKQSTHPRSIHYR